MVLVRSLRVGVGLNLGCTMYGLGVKQGLGV